MSHGHNPLEHLHVITTLTNPIRYKSRYRLYDKFEKHMIESGVNFHVGEVAFGDRPFYTSSKPGVTAHHFRTHEEIWLKENIQNRIIQEFPKDWKYVIWLDSDIEFMDDHSTDPAFWAKEAVHALQHYEVVQMFQHAIDLGPNHEVMHHHKGFVKSYLDSEPYSRIYGGWHPGYGWGWTRRALEAVGGFFDVSVIGSGDDIMAKSLIGKGLDALPKGLNADFVRMVDIWQDRALRNVKKDIGYVPLTIRHFFHGAKKNRQYWNRWSIFTDHDFSPLEDLKRDWQGLYVLEDDMIAMRDGMRRYVRSRREDSNDMF